MKITTSYLKALIREAVEEAAVPSPAASTAGFQVFFDFETGKLSKADGSRLTDSEVEEIMAALNRRAASAMKDNSRGYAGANRAALVTPRTVAGNKEFVRRGR